MLGAAMECERLAKGQARPIIYLSSRGRLAGARLAYPSFSFLFYLAKALDSSFKRLHNELCCSSASPANLLPAGRRLR